MASDLDFSPPEVPEPTFLENLLRYGLFLGAIFQLICVLAIIIPIPKSHEAVGRRARPAGEGAVLGLGQLRWRCLADSIQPQSSDRRLDQQRGLGGARKDAAPDRRRQNHLSPEAGR
ncbi:protein MANBAL isoform 1-T1 [Hipposideros larvatus]